jgi:PQQ-like domain
VPKVTPRHARRGHRSARSLVAVLVVLGAGIAGWLWLGTEAEEEGSEPNPVATSIPTATVAPTPTAPPTPTPVPTPTPYAGWVDPASSGQPWAVEVDGLLTFRGNPTRSYHGSGPVPLTRPSLQWSYPPGRNMCGPTTIAGETTWWCGTGWTGQPAVFERDGTTWTVFGALDHDVHFVDADSGKALLDPFPTGDLIKGSVTIDPDGYPIVYSGSRDNFLRAIAMDRDDPVELWRLNGDGAPGGRWNNDWDGAPLVIDDYLFEGGENSLFHIVKLNRSYDDDGLVQVDPELAFVAPGYDSELISKVGGNVSIENSVAISGNTVYFANSGGLVQGWDIAGLTDGEEPTRVFEYWVGEDVDASVVVDDEGMLYVGVEYEIGRARALEVGQLVKLDPSRPADPLVWSVHDNGSLPSGMWATPAVHRDVVIAPLDTGRVLGIDRYTGDTRWEIPMYGAFNWSSPVVVDDVYLQGDCEGTLHAFDVSDTTVRPPELWSVGLPGCIESTPAVWDGRIIVGTRTGQVHMLSAD